VKPSEAAESYSVSSENFGSYNTLSLTQNMGSGEPSKRAQHLAKCLNILAQKIAAYHQVPERELADLESRHAEEENSKPRVIIYVSIVPAVVSARVVPTNIWGLPPPKKFLCFFNALKLPHHSFKKNKKIAIGLFSSIYSISI
jgi:hypothetical protein